jgi:hypothetical protein
MLLKEIIAVYSDNSTKSINTTYDQNSELLNIKEGGTYRYNWAWISPASIFMPLRNSVGKTDKPAVF